MKTLIKVTFFAAAISLSVNSCSSHKTKKVGQDIKQVADTVGHKTAEIASKGVATITDKVYAGKAGPEGQTIYIDKNSKYFYINKKGHRVFIKESKLKNKED